MSLDLPRTRAVSSTSTTASPEDEVNAAVVALKGLKLSTWQAYKDDLPRSGLLQQLRFKLKDLDLPTNSRDSFRRAQGFQITSWHICNLVEIWGQSPVPAETKDLIQTLSQFLLVLEAALVHHAGNNRYFRTRVDGGGWNTLQRSLSTLLAILIHNKAELNVIEQFYGVLFATAVGDEVLSSIYTNTAKACPPPSRAWDLKSAATIEGHVKKYLDNVTDIAVPDVLPIIIKTWIEYLQKTGKSIQTVNLALPVSLKVLLSISRQNIVEAHTSGLLSAIIPLLFEGQHTLVEKSCYRELALLLFQQGVTNLDDAHVFFSKAATSSAAASFLLQAVRASRHPASIQFDLSRYGSSSIELPTLKKAFPPPQSDGYTLALWVRFDQFDPDAHTTLFGACDKSQTCFVLAYLEKDSHHLILQTATKGSRPSVRFKSVIFEPGKWYHICVVHKKPRTTSSSKAFLFIDGLFVEQTKANFPATPPADRTGVPRVQAFFGTPQDLAPNIDGTCITLWSLASAVLFEVTLNEDLIAVIYHLGPSYHGNMQDCLGSFQTYRASAALNFRNETLNAGNENSSHLSIATRQKASNVLPEDAILLNVSPAAVLDNDDRNTIDESQLIKSLSRTAAKNLFTYTRSGANAVVINGAVPAINDALVQANGVAMLIGEPVVTVPQSMDDVSWRLGGCAAIGLNLVNRARTTEEVATAVDILLETIKDSWRNSEVMERNSGYGILSSLIRDRLMMSTGTTAEQGKAALAIATPSLDRSGLALKLLKSVLSFLGYEIDDPSRSMINNPLAYKILLIDNSVWRLHHSDTQELYFKQFVTFAKDSVHAKFNLKRLSRMRAIRRLLEALKSESVSRSSMPFYSAALSALLPTAMSAEMLRSMALFITYSVHKRSAAGRFRKPARSRTSSGASSVTSPNTESTYLSQFEIGVEILRLYSDMLCAKGDSVMIKKFARTVTNKWLLYLLSETSAEVIVLSTRILARLLIVHGEAYVKKFKEKSGGFAIIAHRLKRWWHLPALWPACFAILFEVDVAELDLDRSFDLFSFVDLFNSKKNYGIVYPEMFEVITGMLQSGLKAIVSSKQHQPGLHTHIAPPTSNTPERLSMSTMAPANPLLTLVTQQNVETFNTIIRFLADLQTRSAKFREYAASSSYVQDLLFVLFPVVVGADVVEATVELNARDSMLSFDGTDVVVQPLAARPPIIRAARKEVADRRRRGKTLRRGSSFVIVSRDLARSDASSDSVTLESQAAQLTQAAENNVKHAVVQSVLEIVVALFVDQILAHKDFAGIGLFLKTPPGFIEHQTFFESWVLRNTVSQLSNAIALNQTLLCEPKVITNLARFLTHLGDAIFEGWFIGGVESVIDLACTILEYLQRPDVSKLKGVRLCTQPIALIRVVVFRVELLCLSHLEVEETEAFLKKLGYWQNVLLAPDHTQSTYLQLLCYLLYGSLISDDHSVRTMAADLWRTVLVQKPSETTGILGQASTADQRLLASSFEKLVELDNETFLLWIDQHREELDLLFFDTLSKSWDAFVSEENEKTEESGKARIKRRKEKLKTWAREEANCEDLLRRHDVTFDHWTSNIYSSETLKHHRLMQDQSDDLVFTNATFSRMRRELARSTDLFSEGKPRKWRVDQTEGRNRMRLRLIEDFSFAGADQQPKRKGSDLPVLRLDMKGLKASSSEALGLTPGGAELPTVSSALPDDPLSSNEPFPAVERSETFEHMEAEETFELVEDPNAGQDDFEDRNRKVMRSLHRGDQVKHVSNISRVAGLEAIEGLLILGKDYIYLIDNFFQRADGEIVHVWQAPVEERDPYVGMISGRDVTVQKPRAKEDEHEARSWKWSEIISISKRRFLFRDVAIEIFFGDGRSYLLTVLDSRARNDLYSQINAKAPQYGTPDSPQSEVAWRYETLKSAEDEPQTLGARFASVFAQASGLSATKKWQKGEMSNFHYLMLINTLAGRTYNDLTQYPVFPWIVADYTSDELDLTNPRVYRDLSKPMGCQQPGREADFRERYKQFAEMGDSNAPPFHYGTHYSSAMIVTSYLIRLQPFVRSYLLLQGGTFDHPDRMFYSIEGAWKSASKTNMTDVRELTPEFYYLPEFLTNPNEYDFGVRQNDKKSIANVTLPPWAKGDPKIFIAKQREALESPYVSKHLHKWIDLVFGCKQKGEAAIDAVNVFHHLSYQGARDLDAISDPVERLATIGIIHNFGQTPYQVFQRNHPARENAKHKYKRLDSAAESLTRIPGTLLDSEERIASLTYAVKADKLLCSGAFRLNIPPGYDKYMEWGFSDNSIRFYAAGSRKQIGLFEHLHIGQLSCALFGDSKTLITAGTDCTIAVWAIHSSNSKSVDVQPKATLFGHRSTVTNLGLSRSFNALISCSSNGELILWDLNRCEFVRRIRTTGQINVECATINDVTGNVIICHGSCISIFTLNGELLLCQDTSERSASDESIISVACYEGAGNEWLERDILFTGHKRGVVKVWSLVIENGSFVLEMIRQLNHVDAAREDGGNVAAGITCILPLPQVVYTGDEDGRVVEWNCVQRH